MFLLPHIFNLGCNPMAVLNNSAKSHVLATGVPDNQTIEFYFHIPHNVSNFPFLVDVSTKKFDVKSQYFQSNTEVLPQEKFGNNIFEPFNKPSGPL